MLKIGGKREKDDICIVCQDSFGESDEVIALPCDSKHIFHNACIAEWLKTKTICPICKKDITTEMIEEHAHTNQT